MMPPAHVSVEAWEEEGRVIKGIRLLAPLRIALVVDRWPAPLHLQVVVPEGYLSDGASVPRILWRLLSPPIDPVTLAPSIVHDWLYDHGASLGLTRIEADEWYADALYRNGYAAWRTMLTYVGVRLGGGSRWTSA